MSDGLHVSDDEAATVIYAAGLDLQLEARVSSHAAQCAECSAKIASLRASDRSAEALLSLLDVPAPRKSARDLVRTAKAETRISARAPRRVAAAIVGFLVLAGVAAAAIPASPLHRLIFGSVARKSTAPANAGRAGPPTAAAASSGVSISAPAALEIVFNHQNAGSVHIRVSDGNQVALASSDVAATYRVGSSRITVSQSGPADFQLEVPRALRELRILAGDTLVFSRGPGTRMKTDTLTVDLSARPRG
ncbi:MAG TPA: hypothetical protein VLJ83_06685 [Gemmatimonadaceae bacterium]|nr:hypothetical protein [Gemmatimonadaceae bacterium]